MMSAFRANQYMGSNTSEATKDTVEQTNEDKVVRKDKLTHDAELLVVKGKINGRTVRVLIDSGATRLFID